MAKMNTYKPGERKRAGADDGIAMIWRIIESRKYLLETIFYFSDLWFAFTSGQGNTFGDELSNHHIMFVKVRTTAHYVY